MSLHVEENYANGIPQTDIGGLTPGGVAWHWSAGGAGRSGWAGTVRHLIATRSTVNASYHGGFWAEHAAGHVGCRTILQWIVRASRAAHSISPSSSWQYSTTKPRAVQDARFTEVRRILGPRARDPNAGVLAIAYAGMPPDLARDLACPVFRADVRDLARQLEAATLADRSHFGHGWIQPVNRYEMDAGATEDFINMLYAEEGDDMQFWKPVEERWNTYPGTVFYDGNGNKKQFTDRVEVRSFAESSDGRFRQVRFGQEILVVDARGPNREGPGLENIPGTRVPPPGSYGFPPDPPTAEQARSDILDEAIQAVANLK